MFKLLLVCVEAAMRVGLISAPFHGSFEPKRVIVSLFQSVTHRRACGELLPNARAGGPRGLVLAVLGPLSASVKSPSDAGWESATPFLRTNTVFTLRLCTHMVFTLRSL